MGAWLLAFAPLALAAPPEAPPEERRRAERLATEAEAAEEAGRHREATRLLQRAVRWDPSRAEDRRRVVAWLEPIEPRAALRHADALLQADERYGFENPTQLTRLRTLARQIGDVETGPIAVRLSRRLIAWGEQQGRFKPHQLAEEWNGAGSEAYRTLDLDSASEAFDRVQRLALEHPRAIDRSGVSWDVMAGVHLQAGRVDRALVSIGLLTDAQGETYDSRALQARAALALGESLAAIDHAERAAELAGPQIPQGIHPRSPYPVLAEAYREINQSERTLGALQAIRAGRPRDTALAIALAEQLALRDQHEAAWRLLQAEVQRLLAAIDSTPADERTPEVTRRTRGRRRRLGEAFAAWAPHSRSVEEAGVVLASAPAVLDRFDGTVDLTEPLARFVESEAAAPVVEAWLAEPADEASPPGRRRAGLAVAYAARDNAAVDRFFKLRVTRLRESGADAATIEAECFDTHYALLDRGEAGSARRLLRWLHDTRSSADAAPSEEERLANARLSSELAFAISRSLPEEPDAREAEIAEVIRLAEQVPRDAPDAFEPALDAYYALWAVEVDLAIAAGERIVERWPTPYAGGEVEELWHRDLINSLARTRQARDAAGDLERAIELDELLLDQDPRDDRALNNLAYEFAIRGEGLARAERMARRAVGIDPEEPNYYDTHGWTLFKLGRYAEARAVLAEGLGLINASTPRQVVEALHEHLAAVDRALGLAEEAEAEAGP